MKMNKMRRLLTLALVLTAAVCIFASMALTAGAEESFEISVDSEALGKCGLVQISWPKVEDADYYVIYIDDVHVASIANTTKYRCGGWKDENGNTVLFEIGNSYVFNVVAIKDGAEMAGKNASVTVTPQHNYDHYYSDSEGHWCDCGESAKVSHSGGTATCLAKAVCEVCKTSYGDLDPNNHETDDTYFAVKDEYLHDIIHSCCNAVKETVEHTESYVYTLDGSKITATCADCGFASSVTLTAPAGTLVYNGKTAEATVSDNIFGLTNADVVYKKNGVAIAGAPYTAGDYTAELTLGDKTAVVSFTIEKALVTIPTTKDSVYTGDTHFSGVEATEFYTVADNGGTNVGTYNAVLSLTDAENYAWVGGSSEDLTLTYNVTIANDKITVSGETIELVYGEKLVPHTATGIFGEVKVTVYNNNGNEVDVNGYLGAGSYTVVYEIESTENWIGDTVTVNAIVSKNQVHINVDSNAIQITFGNALNIPEASANGFVPGESIEVTYTVYDFSNNDVTANIAELPVGTYTIVYLASGTDNWNGNVVEVNVSVVSQYVPMPEADDTVFTYNGSEQTYTLETNPLYTISGNVQAHAGTYTVTVALVDSENYSWEDGTKGDLTFTFVISKKTVTVTANDATAEQFYSIPEFTFTFDGFIDGETFTESVVLGVAIGNTNVVGSYNIVMTSGAVSGDYDLVYEDADFTVTAHVTHIEGSCQVENYVAPTCTATGSYNEVVYCTLCGDKLSSVSKSIEATGHTAGDEADCVHAQTCTVCGEVLASALGHTEVVDKAVAPTCTENGLTEGKHCSVCNAVTVAQTVVYALGHDFDAGKVTTAPDCVNEGVKTYTCKHDATHQYTQTLQALGHTEVVDNAVAPTCTENGLTEGKHCSVCNTVTVAQTVVDALGHTAGTAADCENDQVCTVCNAVLASALGHTPGDEATCTIDQTCTKCGKVLKSAFGHKYIDIDTATCTKSGNIIRTCTVCGHELLGIVTPALGHSFGDATCVSLPVCSVCGVEDATAEYAECTYTIVSSGDGTHSKCCALSAEHNVNGIACTPANEATCTEPAICSVCNGAIGKALGHTPAGNPTCTKADTCTVCNATIGKALGHTYGKGVVDSNICSVCGELHTNRVLFKAAVIAAALLIVIIVIKLLRATPTTTPWWKRMFRR